MLTPDTTANGGLLDLLHERQKKTTIENMKQVCRSNFN